MGVITVGDEAINRAYSFYPARTFVYLTTAASGTGSITSVNIYSTNGMTGVYVGLFYKTTGTNYKCRSAVSIGDLSAGLNTFTVNSAVVKGDFLGGWRDSGGIKKDDNVSGHAGFVTCDVTNNHTIVGDEQSYNTLVTTENDLSFYGTGVTVGRVQTGFMVGSYSRLIGRRK